LNIVLQDKNNQSKMGKLKINDRAKGMIQEKVKLFLDQ